MNDLSRPAAPPPAPPLRLLQQIAAYRTSHCIRTAVELGIPAALQEGPRTAGELAERIGGKAELLARLLGHLVNEEIIGRDDAGRYIAMPTTRALVPGHPHSLVPWVRFELDPLHGRAWERLGEQIKSGTPAFELAHGSPFFSWLGQDEAAQGRFDIQMRAIATALIGVAVRHIQFSAGETIVDVGGGDGSLLAELLRRNPGTSGVLYELPRATEALNPHFAELVQAGRARVEHGSFFDEIPSGGDAYVFSRILHDFDDKAAGRILANAKAATQGPERFIVVDIMVDPARGRPNETSQDLLMMVLMGGQERSAGEFSQLLAASGFETASVTPTASPFQILEFRHPR
ncbi:methyltransferase [Bosea sp. FBZP-16]|uniref:methyltransferase n=1 Tax=Bosea sp. FBZP-16 TaxID=2065382 RepID=UPI000C31983C|nr:methyltransferase [Bosea sp. FBZP-16]